MDTLPIESRRVSRSGVLLPVGQASDR